MTLIEEISWRVFKGGSKTLRNALEALIADAGNIHGDTGKEFVKNLLERYTYLSRDDYDNGIFDISERLHSNFDMAKTLLCATAADHQKDSAQMVLYDLTTAMGLHGHTKIHSANRYDRAQQFAGQIEDIVLVDEFVGTGRSIIGRVNTIEGHFKQKKIQMPRIHAYVVAAMDFGLEAIQPHVKSIYAHISLKPGLRGFLDGKILEEAYATLDAIEGGLAPTVSGQSLPRHGDGACEALYARKMGNCPNSVLPMFWWPHDHKGMERVRPFTRVF